MKEALQSTLTKVFLTFFVAFTLVSLTTDANGSHGIIEGGKGLILAAISLMGFFYAYFIAEQDVKRTIKGSHVKEWLLRCVYVSAIPAMLYFQGSGLYVVGVAICGGASFFLVFNRFYNKMKNYDPEYVGREATTDKLIRFLKIEKYYFMIRLIIWISAHTITIIIL